MPIPFSAYSCRLFAMFDSPRLCCYVWPMALAILLAVGCERSAGNSGTSSVAPAPPSASAADSIAVTCHIHFPGGRGDISSGLKLPGSANVFDALKMAADQHSIDLQFRGADATLFVTAIGGTENGGAGGDNWVYRVDGELGDRSAGVFELKNGQKVEWSFGVYP